MLKSDRLKADFQQYLISDFYQEYVGERDRKLRSTVTKILGGKNPKSIKLPWTNKELQRSIALIFQQVRFLTNSN